MFESHCQLQEPLQAVRFAGVFALLGGSKIEPQYSDVDFDPARENKITGEEGSSLFSGDFAYTHSTCSIKFPIFSAALSCIWRVACVYVRRVKPAS